MITASPELNVTVQEELELIDDNVVKVFPEDQATYSLPSVLNAYDPLEEPSQIVNGYVPAGLVEYDVYWPTPEIDVNSPEASSQTSTT